MLRDQIRPFIPQIVSRELTNRELAALLNASEGAVCRVLKQLKVVRDPAPNGQAQRELLQARKAHRIHAANTMTIKAAAQAAGCSTRTIYRLRGKNAQKP